MSRETWLTMVQVAKQKFDARTQPVTPRKRRRRTSLHRLFRCVREDHYALLLAAGY